MPNSKRIDHAPEAQPTWQTARWAARTLGINERTVPRVAAAGGVRTRQLPGMAPKYRVEDVLRVAREAELAPA